MIALVWASSMAGGIRRTWRAGLLVAVLFVLATIAPAAESTKTAARTNAPMDIEIRGRVVCLAEEMHRLHQAALPTKHEHVYGLKADDGKFFTLLRTKYSEALFTDARLQEKELLLKGRLFPGSQIIEPTLIRSVRNGVVHDLYYYCDVCAIKAVSPEPCSCCQGPVELVEKPLKDSEE